MRRAMLLLLVLGLPPSALGCNDASPLGEDPSTNAETPAAQIETEADLGDLGGGSSLATDINNSNVVVGWSFLASGAQRAFRWNHESGMVDLGTLPGHDFSRATAIDDNGRVLGLSGLGGTLDQRIVVWSSSGAITELGVPLPNASQGDASDFNADGEVVGWELAPGQRAWHWSSSGGRYDITADAPPDRQISGASQINAFGLVVGTSAVLCESFGQCTRPFLWTGEGTYTELVVPDGTGTASGFGVNNSGTVVGWAQTVGGQRRPYKWHASAGFAWLSAAGGAALHVNAFNTVVGSQFDGTNPGARAVAWNASGDLIVLSPANHNAHVATSVNDHDVAVGFTSNALGNVTRAMVWPVADGAGVTASVRAPIAGVAQPIVRTGAVTCIIDAAALVTRASLFNCLAKGAAQ